VPATVSGALPPDIFGISPAFPENLPFSPFLPRFPPFRLTQINETPKIAHFPKKNPEKFCQFGKKQYLCTRFPENGTAETETLLTQTVEGQARRKSSLKRFT